MTDMPHLIAGRDTLVHWWRCHDRRVVERVETDPTGRAVITGVCEGCGGTDRGEVTQ